MHVTTRIAALAVCLWSAGGGAAETSGPDEALARTWSRSCALCHVSGAGGAPRVGQVGDWGSRLVQSRETLLEHTVEGFGNMPPLGYCMSCDRDDFLGLIDFMVPAAPAGEPEP